MIILIKKIKMIILIKKNHIKTKQTSGNYCRKQIKRGGSRANQATSSYILIPPVVYTIS